MSDLWKNLDHARGDERPIDVFLPNLSALRCAEKIARGDQV